MAANEFTIDDRDFLKKFQKLAKTAMPDTLEDGMAAGILELRNASILEHPAVPQDEATLRGSASTFVQNKLTSTSEDMGKGGTPTRDHSENIKGSEIVAVLGFNTPYASVQHEGQRQDGTHKITNYTTEGTGAKFVEAKMAADAARFMKVVAEQIKDSLRA